MIEINNKIRAILRNRDQQMGSAKRNLDAKAFNIAKENAHMAIEFTLKAWLLRQNPAFCLNRQQEIMTHNLSDLADLDNKRLILAIKYQAKSDLLAQNLLHSLMKLTRKEWWKPDNRYYGSCDRKTAYALIEEANHVLAWGDAYIRL